MSAVFYPLEGDRISDNLPAAILYLYKCIMGWICCAFPVIFQLKCLFDLIKLVYASMFLFIFSKHVLS